MKNTVPFVRRKEKPALIDDDLLNNARLDAVFAYESEKLKNISINKTSIVINSYLISITSFPNIKDGLRHYLNKIDKNLDVKSENVLNYYKFTIYTK